MFRTKKDVERHVNDVLSKIDNENEKNLRGYTFARLYYQVKDYESAKKYLSAFLSVRHQHAASHKLMAQIYEATNNPENALQSYKRSLDIDSHQNDVVLKICELYCQIPVDHETARYWADRAEQLYPHHEIVFKLREYLVSAEGEPDRQELENLIATELAAQPKNIDLRIKLLRLYLDTERVKEAYDHATMIESKRLFTHSVDWYYLLGDIFEAYQEENGQDVDAQFYINYLTAMDHLIYLTIAEPHTLLENGKKPSSLNDAAAVLLTFDQLLKKAVLKDIKEGSWTYFIHHMKGQLYFHMTCLLLKRAKMDQGNRKEAFRFSSGLSVVCYIFKPINLLQESWFSKMEDNQKAFTNFFQQGTLRTSFIGNVLLSLCTEDKSNWLQKIKSEVCIPQVKERIYNRIFTSLVQKNRLSASYFITDLTFEQSSLELPTEIALKEYDTSASKLCPDSLHHLVWLQLHVEKCNGLSHVNIPEIFKNLQFNSKNLSKGSCESLCVLDLEAFLYASIYESKIMIERRNSIHGARNDSILCFPPHIADALCTKTQAAWWATAHGLYNCSIKEKLGEHRHNLQRGLEVIRGIGNHGMEVQLVVYLARTFSSKADALDKNTESKNDKNKNKLCSDHVTSLYARAVHYWNLALGMLEKLASGHTSKLPQTPLFSNCGKILSKIEIKELQEEGQLFLAVRLMDSDKLNEAAEILSKLSSPYGSYYLALVLKNLASQESKYSSAKTALLNKSKNSLLDTMDRIKDDKSHPLNKEIFIELEDVENDLATKLNMTGDSNADDIEETDTYDGVSINNSSHSLFDYEKSTAHSTPRPSSKFMASRRITKSSKPESPSQHFEPSPERLDAQIRALTLNQDTLVKSFFQQQQTLIETNKSIVEVLNKNTEALEQLKKLLDDLCLSNLKPPKTVPKKAGYLKGPNEEEEYYDPSNILDYYEDGGDDFRTSGYSFDRSSRIVHDPPPGASAPLNYVVSPALPSGPPPLNHYNYQYPPHAVLPTPPPAVERPPYYHPPPGQGLPFSEGQQLPQFHFHVASPVVKQPPPPTCLSQIVPTLPPPPINMQPVVMPPPPPPTAAPMSAPSPWTKPVTVPHAFQIPLPTSVFVSSPSSIVQSSVSSIATAITTHSQLKDLLQTPVSKTITFGQPLTTTTSVLNTSPSIFSGYTKTPEIAKDHSRCDNETIASPDIDAHELEKEVMGDFKPLIPLPAEIVVETGEENESGLFEDRAKLYRFVDQEWKERGIGIVKILHHESSGRVRLLMRRDQVLKVCANHYLGPNMELKPLKNSDKAWTWVAQDFADEELRPEHLCIRFKTPEIAAAFKTAFDKAVAIAKETEAKKIITSPKITSTVTTSPISHKSFGAKFLPKAGSWTCPTCYVSNPGEKLLCIACETKKPGLQTTVVSSATTIGSFGSEIKSPFQAVSTSASSFSFGIPTASTGVPLSTGITSTSTEKNVFGGFTFTTKPCIQEAETPEVKDREILLVSTKAKNGPQVTKVDTSKTSPFSGFSFKSSNLTITPISTQNNVSNPVNISVSSPSNSISSLQALVQNISPAYTFTKNSFSNTDAVSTSSTTKANTSGSLLIHVSSEGRRVSTDGNDCSPEDFVPTVEFKPVVSLPALVDLKTGEENEEVVFVERAKLFRFDSETKEWKERGTGELKILGIKDTKKYRILMRRDQVLKICANHYILPDMTITPLNNSDKAWIWIAQDYSDGEVSQVKLAAKFKTSDIAQQFLKAFKQCQKELNESSKETDNELNPCVGNKGAFNDMMQTSTNLWVCYKCKKTNMSQSLCVYCQTLRDEVQVTSDNKPLSELFKPAAGSWECTSCYVRNDATANICVSCSCPNFRSNTSFKDIDTKVLPANTSISSNSEKVQQSLSSIFKPQTGSWECESCLVRNNADVTKCAACESLKPGTSAPPSGLSKFQFGSSVSTDTSKFGFENIKSTDEFVFGMKPAPQPTTFAFGVSELSNKSSETIGFKPALPNATGTPAVFGGATQKLETSQSTSIFGGNPQTTEKSQTSSIFGGSLSGGPLSSVFGNTQKSISSQSIFGGGTQKSESSISVTPVFGVSGQFEPPSSSVFGKLAPKSDSSIPATGTSLFGNVVTKSDSDIPTTSAFGTLPAKSESLQTVPSNSESSKKGEISQKSAESSSTTQQPVFSFGSFNQGNEGGPTEFRFGSPQKYEFNFSGVRPRSPTKTPKSPRSPATPSDVEDDEENESFDADNIYFQPVIPLPPKVDTKTGEENETTLFCKRAKLFRFCSGEWKERGIGDIKILKDKLDKKSRLLMRRDQVLKVCLNHYLSDSIIFEKRGDKTWQWAATDFSENEPSPELFALRFKTAEFADEFKTAIDDALNPVDKVSSGDVSKSAASFSFKTDSSKVESPFSAGSLSSRFGTSSFEAPVFGNTPTITQSSSSLFSFKDKSSSTFFNQPTSFSESNLASASNTSKMGTSKVSFDSTTDDGIQIVYEAQASSEEAALAKKLMLSPTFFLYKNKTPCPGCIGCEDYVPPQKGTSNDSTEKSASATSIHPEETDSPLPDNGIFAAKSSVTFADLATNSQSFSLDSSSSKKNLFEGAGTPLFAGLNTSAEGDGDDDTVAPAPDIHFEPVIPLPELVAVKTGEEDETPVFINRAKLFRFDPVKKEWKERGIGDMKILKHKEKLRFRIILRRDQVHKIACNHFITENMELSPLNTSNNALCWNAVDYSENQPEGSHFAVRFKTPELVQQFKEKFNECQELLKNAASEVSSEVQDIGNAAADIGNAAEDQPVETPKSVDEKLSDSHNDHESSESETNDDEDEEDSDTEPLFEKRVTFEISDGNDNEYKPVGIGTLKVMYDDNVYGYHVYMYSDEDECLCDHIIAIQTFLSTDNKKATWAAIDLTVDPPRRRKFRATFSSLDAVEEFRLAFEDGKDAAVHAEIVEKQDLFLPSGPKT